VGDPVLVVQARPQVDSDLDAPVHAIAIGAVV